MGIDVRKIKLTEMIAQKQIGQEGILARFLGSNSRKDRDALIKRRAEIRTLKEVNNELF